MRRIVNSTYVSLDGVIENPHTWPSLPEDDRAGEIQAELLLACDTLLMGRHTYDGFAPVWPTRSGDPFSDHINTMQKYVVSTTLRNPQWQNTKVIERDPVDTIERLRAEPGKDMVQYGFGRLSFALLERGLLDEIRFWVHPFFVGTGGPGDLLYRDAPAAMLDLAGAQTLRSGIVVLTYRKPA